VIARILIGGQVMGTPPSVNATDHYGIVAEQINAVSIGGTLYGRVPGRSNDVPIALGATGDVMLVEVA
jgi:hypothetical protein